MQKLGKNHGGYHGERIEIRAVLRQLETSAQTHGWTKEIFHEADGFSWLALRRPPISLPAPHSALRIYVSAGIHGDEPAGPLAALQLIHENHWPDDAEIFLLPCLNPIGFTNHRRENADRLDLNRDYRHPQAASTRAHIAWLERQPTFDLYLCLHEDWEAHGFYLYEQNPDQKESPAEHIIAAVQKVCPIDRSENIEGRIAQNGIIRPNQSPSERPDWPEAFYLISHKARHGYTLEAPSDFKLTTRTAALVWAVNTAMKKTSKPTFEQ